MQAHPETLAAVVSRRAREHPARLACTFLADGEIEAGSLTFTALDAAARAVGSRLLERAERGERVLLMYDAGLDFVSAFLGCLYAGVVAVPLPALEAGRTQSGRRRLEAVIADCGARLLLGNVRTHALLRTAGPPPEHLGEDRWIDTREWAGAPAANDLPLPSPDSLAYLQYTSGSTATPRGVMISHANLANHLAAIQAALAYGPDSVSVCWMPHFHDYGLVEGILLPLFNGTPAYLLSPFAFLKRPSCWLAAIGKYRGTHTQAFNYAYRYCVRRIGAEQRARLDLSSLRSAGNGGEAIHPDTFAEFYAAFAGCGIRREALNPVYGLAEATLIVTAASAAEPPLTSVFDADALSRGDAVPSVTADGQRVVACGRPLPDTDVVIADPETSRRCPAGRTGEIWVSSPGVACGYLGRAGESDPAFRARLAGEENGRTYLRTGDIGFLHDGQLYISSRLKDLIILRGLNHYPQDIEWTAQRAHPSLRPDHCAAFGIEADGEEQLCIVQEIERTPDSSQDLDAVFTAIADAVTEQHGVAPYAVTLIPAGSIPKTTSGKIQRSACRRAFLDGSLKVIRTWPETRNQPAGRKRADELIAWLRDYAEHRINSRLIDERRCLPPNIVLDFGNRGVFGLQAPEHYGGLDLSHSDALRVYTQLAAIDPTIATLVFLHTTNGSRPILRYAQPKLRDELMPLLAQGRQLAAFTLSEPGAGTNLAAVQAKIVPDGDGAWRIYGTKRWNGSAWTGVITVFGRLVDSSGKARGMTAFVVRQTDPGVKIGPESLTMGVRGIMQNAVTFDGVRVTAARMLGEPGKGMQVADDVLSHGRLATASVALGAAMRAAQLILRYVSRREIETGLLLENPQAGVQMSRMVHRIAIERETLAYCAARLDAGDPILSEISMCAKVSATDTGNFAADLLVQLLGGRGYMENNLAPQIFRDTRMLSIGEGANEGLLAAIGRSLRMTDAVPGFLERWQPGGELSRRLAEVSRTLETSGTGPYTGSAAAAWRDAMRGRLAVVAVNVAAAASVVRQGGAPETLDWARQRFDELCEEAQRGPGPALPPNRLRDAIDGLRQAIGDVEPLAPDVDVALDPLLRRESVEQKDGQAVREKREKLRLLLAAKSVQSGRKG